MLTFGIPDVISPSYFPLIAASDLGCFAAEGLETTVDLVAPVDHAVEVMRDGGLDFVGGCAHSAPHAFPQWRGAKIVGALSQNTYWFLVVRPDAGVTAANLSALSGLTIGAAPLVDLALLRTLRELGIEDVDVRPVPGAFLGSDRNFGVAAAKALEAGLIDGFWANGMGTEVAVRAGTGTVVLDARRGQGPPGSEHYTFAALLATDALIQREPDTVAAVVRGLVAAQRALAADPSLAAEVGCERFPEFEATLIADLIARDAPFYQAAVAPERIDDLSRFQLDMGLADGPVSFGDVVAADFAPLWS
ncbi:ABC transporter substrate-binding protein [Streptomyces sp. 6N223]|uniref:ABC transporter substrate-binding protein n=1 Tax=Streptomyces sp. 6N223 TaxID=3457412 RepID=UPI003FD5CEE0